MRGMSQGGWYMISGRVSLVSDVAEMTLFSVTRKILAQTPQMAPFPSADD